MARHIKFIRVREISKVRRKVNLTPTERFRIKELNHTIDKAQKEIEIIIQNGWEYWE